MSVPAKYSDDETETEVEIFVRAAWREGAWHVHVMRRDYEAGRPMGPWHTIHQDSLPSHAYGATDRVRLADDLQAAYPDASVDVVD